MSNPFAGAAAAPQSAPAAQPAAGANPFGGGQAAPAAQPAPAPSQAEVDAFVSRAEGIVNSPAAPAAGGDQFGMPSGGGSGSKIADDLGQALLVRPTEVRTDMKTQHGLVDAVQADWIVLTGPEAGQVRESSLVFQTMLVGDLKKILANPATPFMVGFLTKAEPSPGKSAAFIFATPDEAQVALARQAAAHFGWI